MKTKTWEHTANTIYLQDATDKQIQRLTCKIFGALKITISETSGFLKTYETWSNKKPETIKSIIFLKIS